MLPNKVIKLGIENTYYGLAVVLMVDGQRTLGFPQQIDSTDRDEIDNYHPTICWPMGEPLTKIREFPPGPMLPGWDILGAYRGRIGEDPWKESSIILLNKKNEGSIDPTLDPIIPSTENTQEDIHSAFDYAENAVTNLSPPSWVTSLISSLRLIHLPTRRKTTK